MCPARSLIHLPLALHIWSLIYAGNDAQLRYSSTPHGVTRAHVINIVAVCHGGIMNSFRLLLEKIRTTDSDIINEMRTGKEQLLNGHILWYSRMNPYTKEIHDNFKWLYNICPWKENNLEYNINRWKVIDKISFNNDELKEIINKIQPII